MTRLNRWTVLILLVSMLALSVFAQPVPNGCMATGYYSGGDQNVYDKLMEIYGEPAAPVVEANPSSCFYGVDSLNNTTIFSTGRETTFEVGEEFWCGWGGC